MEFQIQSLTLVLGQVLLVVLLTFGVLRFRQFNPKLPPGPWKLPIIGSLHHLVGSMPHHALRSLSRKYGPLMHLRFGEVSTIVVSSAEVAKQVLKTNELNFADRPEIPSLKILTYNHTNMAFSPYGDHWRHLRKICTSELLSAKRVGSFQQIRQEAASNLVKRIASNAGSPTNLTQLLSSTTCGIIASTAFGNKCSSHDQDGFLDVTKNISSLGRGFEVIDIFPSRTFLHLFAGTRTKIEEVHRRSDRILENIIKEHRRKTGAKTAQESTEAREDLIDVLLKFENRDDQGRALSPDSIKAVILDIFTAGSETSANTLDWAMVEMIKNPRILEKAQAEVRHVFNRKAAIQEDGLTELKYLKLIIKEVLRLHPALPLLLPRECREKCEINGFEIPQKTRVIINMWAIGRDPDSWKDPETFYPERFVNSPIDYKGNNFEYIPFGAGRRICPGLIFSTVVLEHLLAVLLYHFDWKLPDGVNNKDLDMTELFGLSVRRKDELYVIPTPYLN